MADEFIPEDIKEFIVGKIHSVAQLEGLLLLRRDPLVEWGAEALAGRLYISQGETAEVLSHLHREGLLALTRDSPATYKYQPDSPEAVSLVDRLAEVYAKYLVAVTHLIHSTAPPKVQKFADAFRIRKGAPK
jgi:hypothetical protein